MTMSRSSFRMRCTHSTASLGLARRLHREDVVVLVLEVAGLIGPQAGQRGRHWRRLETDGRDGVEIHRIGHDALLITALPPPT